jgi:hypothetical protein
VNNPTNQNDEHGMLETTAQAIGSTLGNLAVKTGIAKPPAAMEHSESNKHTEPAAESQPQNQHPNRKARRAKKKK